MCASRARKEQQISRFISISFSFAKVAEPLKALTGSMGGLNGIGGELTSRLTKENDLLKGLLEQGIGKKGLPGKILPKGLPGGLKLPF